MGICVDMQFKNAPRGLPLQCFAADLKALLKWRRWPVFGFGRGPHEAPVLPVKLIVLPRFVLNLIVVRTHLPEPLFLRRFAMRVSVSRNRH